ncbi:reprolysin-like metallopeptidase [uncultured Flavobacterium sp.]|uniref:zinc-dependent metalloprotease n=1 Tax=uncultured Flavobacterium sp. TaxID=165435 RepID=UPI0030EBFC79
MKKLLLFSLFLVFSSNIFAQTSKIWKEISKNEVAQTNKNVERESFPQEFKLYQVNVDAIKQSLLSAPDRFSRTKSNAIISLPNVKGIMEKFEVFEASNFEAALQAQYPNIRSYIGIGLDDKNAQIRLSFDPSGIQTMVFRAGKQSEFMEPYSQDGSVYAIYNSSRNKGKLPFTCSTEDHAVINDINPQTLRASNGVLKTLRLALSCNGEYSNYFGATSSAQVANVLAAFNATMTRVNGVFEKDFAVHMNIVAQSTNVIYYDPATDPYTTLASWNTQLQVALNTTLTGPSTALAANNAAYDVGHMFGASGGGGNAGCIGCLCVDGVASGAGSTKGRGITSPADGVPAGDTFDIDYVAHELGHQFGANHTFSMSLEGTGVNVEPGSGSTIMGYAGITGSTDVQQNSDDYFAYRSIAQVQTNLLSKTCPTTIAITHGAPVMNAGSDWIIPNSTPFILTGSGTDPNNDPLTYCWEQNNNATVAFTTVSPTNTTSPNWRSRNPETTGVRYMPKLASVLSNTLTSDYESVSSVARTLNFTLTGRDNVVNGAQTGTDEMIVNVSGTVGPFDVTSQAADGISWTQGSTQTITWTVNGTTGLVGSANVDIMLSLDGGQTFTTTLASNTLNDGSEVITVPNVAAPFCRVMVKPTGNIYYDINSKDFAVGFVITNSCNTYTNATSLPIPDGTGANVPGATATNTIIVPVTGTLSDVNIGLNVTHTWPNDLVIGISHPNATQDLVWNRSCGSNDNFNITMSDGSPSFSCVANMTGTFSPASPLAVFNGLVSNGTWTLSATDFYNADPGTVNSWSIEVCSQSITASAESFGLSDFSLYPNPNNGNFTVQFNSESTNNINISVHDLRGREVYSNAYKNNGLFNQTLNLNNIMSGIYLVTVQDGSRKEVKKIIVE